MKTGDAATHREFESHTLRQKIPHPKGVWYFLASWRFEPSNPTVRWTVGGRLLPPEPLFLQRTLQKCNRISTLRPPPIKQKPPINESPAYPPTFEQGESNRISHSPPASNQAKASNQRVPRIPTDLRTGRKQPNLHSPPPPIKQKPPINESPAYPPTFEQGESNRISTLRPPPIKQKPLFKDSSIYPPTFVTGTQKCNRISTLRCPFFHSTFYASSPRHPCTKNPIVL